MHCKGGLYKLPLTVHNKPILRILNYITLILFVSSLAFNYVGASLVTSKRLATLNEQAWVDAVVLCTGKGFAWYSQSAFHNTGELVEVDAPTLPIGSSDEHDDCALGLSIDLNNDGLVASWAPSLLTWLSLPRDISIQQLIYLSTFYPDFSGRAPPSS